MLNELINYDKIEMDKFRVEKRVCDPFLIVEKTVKPLFVQARQREVDLIFASDHDRPGTAPEDRRDIRMLRVYGDAVKLGQVVRNVVSNALKFTPTGGKVKVRGELWFCFC